MISTDGTRRSLHTWQMLLSPSRLFKSKSSRERIALHFEHTFVFNSFRLPVDGKMKIFYYVLQLINWKCYHLWCHRIVSRRQYSSRAIHFGVFAKFPTCHRRSQSPEAHVPDPEDLSTKLKQFLSSIGVLSPQKIQVHRIQNSRGRFYFQDIAEARNEFYSIMFFHRRL